VLSLRLKDELKRLLLPYLALGFDQNMIVNGRAAKSITIGELQTVEHLCKYGRPLYAALVCTEIIAQRTLDGVRFSLEKETVWSIRPL
jgi:hypothetical protein